MTKRAATQQAAAEITMYRQGSGWIVSQYDERVGCKRTSGEQSFWMARVDVRDSRAARVAQLLAR